MQRHLLLTAATALLLLLLLHSTASSSSPSVDNSLSNCDQTFNCGPLVNVSYPFTGGDRPDHCGPPEFRLGCVGGFPEFTAGLLTYRVLALDQTRQSLTLSRTDLYNNICLSQYANTTLNSSIFTFVSDDEDLTLFYGCWTIMTVKPQNLFSCEINGTETDNYYLLGALPTDPILNVSTCNVSVTVRILQSAVNMLTANRSKLREALMEGFEVNYTNPYEDECVRCGGIGGECGFDSDLGKPICSCDDRICSTSTAGSNRWRKLIIGGAFAIGASISAIAIIFTWKVPLFKNKKDRGVERLIGIHGSLAPRRYRYTDLKKMTNSFSEKLGQGGFGAVYKGKIKDDCLVAVKILTESKSSPEEFINEVVSISRTSHVNVITLLGFCYEGKKRALVFEYMPNGSLDKFIYSGRALNRSSSLEWKLLYHIAIGIARGLEYLHRGCNTRILHFDIKPHNILLDRDFNPKISDFGLAKLCHGQESAVSTLGMRGTVGFIAPEVVFRNLGRVSHKSDVYSYGMLVLDMVGFGSSDIKFSNSSEVYFPEWIYRNLEPGKELKLPMNVTEEEEVLARKMIIVSLWCIQTSPSDRPPIVKVIEMLEGSFQSLQMPPKPILYSPSRSLSQHWEMTTSTSYGSREEDRILENLEESNN
ncbi:LEAF RUST 10 DISEASE-RESISTANCE LOCUS RECEPTOR-LIKE PROTEIN KINASE-like 2.4 [Syzygium oleosum]|uniref:LEAF RUST 10 DISEASE-RESISTANCE LOCUS RECEPTOR-LIKE PROTEIN KINASE-like 2.4 n=1 Tax=Syzygium oleosum TaxID=219896 RepID=UPI0024B9E591|nr:LEAF RUST 10 DISEASE-RESISTANCE LOCUS RECEPTOR-LIKE PROTEIN KINASE-like 2.4 [Syzygium oleosum]